MVKSGLLGAELSPSEGARYWRINKASVVDLMNALTERCLDVGKHTSSVMELTNATRDYVMKSGLDSAQLLLQVRNGLVRIYHKEDQPIRIRSLLLDRSDIDESLKRFYAENGWVDRMEAIRLLRTHPKTLTRWVNSGILIMQKYKTSHVFDRRKIEEFLANHVRSKDAAEILGVDKKDVNVLARLGLLKAVSGPSIDGYSCHIFKRETLFKWKNDWLTHKEATKLLEVEKDLLFDFAKGGLIVTLKPRYGGKLLHMVRKWYSRQSILELQEKIRSEKA